tara:strand:- start:393 stop:614 length:222 start_codon:yes stop_codon:yes gene_type:complete
MINKQRNKSSEIFLLQKRLSILEKKLEAIDNEGPIKSLTFREGSKDDRIRIYWSSGKKTDLPCTKEQSIWACG